jgi:hypothetical protein
MFGDLTEQHVLLFFLPPNARLLADDCTDRLGGHGIIVTKDNKRIPYAYFDTCAAYASPSELAMRTHSVTHELMEIATDPDPDAAPAWRTLGAGLLAPSVRPSMSSVDNEGADFCNDAPAEAPDYPFEVARNYSNRLARAGRDPCDLVAPLPPLAALSEGEPSSVDLSSGKARIKIDIFAADVSGTLVLSANAALSHDNATLQVPLLKSPTLPANEGDGMALDLELSLPAYLAAAVAQATRYEVVIHLCPVDSNGNDCSDSRFPIKALPPILRSPDAGSEDAGGDGSAVADAGPG